MSEGAPVGFEQLVKIALLSRFAGMEVHVPAG